MLKKSIQPRTIPS